MRDNQNYFGNRNAKETLTEETVRKLRTGSLTIAQAMKLTGASRSALSRAKNYVTWRHVA